MKAIIKRTIIANVLLGGDTIIKLDKAIKKVMIKELDKIDDEWDTDNSTAISAIRSYRNDIEKHFGLKEV